MSGADDDPARRRDEAEAGAAERLSLLLSGAATSADRLEIDAWRASHPARDRAWTRLSAIWDLGLDAADEPSVAAMRTRALAAGRAARRTRWKPLLMAASLAVVVGGGAFLASEARKADIAGSDTQWSASSQTGVGEIRALTLQDGSIVTLNSDSAVRTAIGASARRVRIERGEARFDVARNPAAPFTVEADGVTVTAVGTAFSVRKLDGEVRVTLSEGRVRVRSATGGEAMMEPGMQLRADAAGFHIARVDPARVDAWTAGMLAFTQTPLEEVVRELNRYSRQRITLSDPALAALPVTGTFPVGKPEELVALLVANGSARVSRRSAEGIDLVRP